MKLYKSGAKMGITYLQPESINELIEHLMPNSSKLEKRDAYSSWLDDLESEKESIEISTRLHVDLEYLRDK